MRILLLSVPLLAGFAVAGEARAQTLRFNDIVINASGPGNGITALEIVQDSQHPYSQIAADTAAGSTAQLPVTGKWNRISVTQGSNAAKGANILAGSMAADAGSTTGAVVAGYATAGAGDNVHTLVIGAGSHGAPVNPTVSVAVSNTGGAANTITDALDSGDALAGGSLSYALSVTGTGNAIATTVQAGEAVSVGMLVSGEGNAVVTTATGGISASIDHRIYSSGNTVMTKMAGGGAQASAVTIGAGSRVNYAQESLGANQAVTVSLTDVMGNTGNAAAPADVVVYQTALATGGAVSLTYSGTGYTAGNLVSPGVLPSNYTPTAGSSGPAIYVYQNSSTPITVNAAGTAGYTLRVTTP